MEEGLKIAAMAGAFWIGVAIARWRHPELFKLDPRDEPEANEVWPSAGRSRLFGNKDRRGGGGGAE